MPAYQHFCKTRINVIKCIKSTVKLVYRNNDHRDSGLCRRLYHRDCHRRSSRHRRMHALQVRTKLTLNTDSTAFFVIVITFDNNNPTMTENSTLVSVLFSESSVLVLVLAVCSWTWWIRSRFSFELEVSLSLVNSHNDHALLETCWIANKREDCILINTTVACSPI